MFIKECPKCKNGKLTKRSGRFGDFYGCSNYPKCKHTEKIKKTLPIVVNTVRDWSKFSPSSYQLAILDSVQQRKNTLVNATAGSGKTNDFPFISG